jgi:putative transposase
LARYQRDLPHIRPLGHLAAQLDALFHHRLTRSARKGERRDRSRERPPRMAGRTGTVSYQGRRFEVPYTPSGKQVRLVVDPHRGQVVGVEDADGNDLGAATPLDTLANATRQRHRPGEGAPTPPPADGPNAVELAYHDYHRLLENHDEDDD